jgi:hypothetical protein
MTYYDNPEIDDWHKQIILGTVLGGSSLVKPKKGRNCYLFMRSANKDWLNYKAEELVSLSSQRPFTHEGNTLRWHSNCYPVFTEYYSQFYNSGEKLVKMEILDTLRDIGLAIWYGDCGKIKKGKVTLNTNKFGEEGTQIISRYFKEAGIGETFLVKERKYIRLAFSEAASEKFLMVLANRLPDFMHSKLLPK